MWTPSQPLPGLPAPTPLTPPHSRGRGPPASSKWTRERLQAEHDRIRRAKAFLKGQRRELRARQRAMEEARAEWQGDMERAKHGSAGGCAAPRGPFGRNEWVNVCSSAEIQTLNRHQ